MYFLAHLSSLLLKRAERFDVRTRRDPRTAYTLELLCSYMDFASNKDGSVLYRYYEAIRGQATEQWIDVLASTLDMKAPTDLLPEGY